MSNSIITAAGAALIAACQANEEILVIDKMIFADVPDLDTGVMPPDDTVLPPSGQIKLQADIVQAGLVNSNTIVYSVTLGATAGPFYINWIGLYSSAHNTLVAVCYVPRHYKFATDGFRTGNTLYKNFALQVANVSELTGVIISAGTWQQDLTAVLANYALAHTHPYEPIGAAAAHNIAESPHVGKFDFYGTAIAVLDAHEAESNPHTQYLRTWTSPDEYDIPATGGTLLSVNHNLTAGMNSAQIAAFMSRAQGMICFKCVTAEYGWAVGDIVCCGAQVVSNDSTYTPPPVGLSATSIWSHISWFGHANAVIISEATSGEATSGFYRSITRANWVRFFRIHY